MKLLFENWRKFLDEERKAQELLKEQPMGFKQQLHGGPATLYPMAGACNRYNKNTDKWKRCVDKEREAATAAQAPRKPKIKQITSDAPLPCCRKSVRTAQGTKFVPNTKELYGEKPKPGVNCDDDCYAAATPHKLIPVPVPETTLEYAVNVRASDESCHNPPCRYIKYYDITLPPTTLKIPEDIFLQWSNRYTAIRNVKHRIRENSQDVYRAIWLKQNAGKPQKGLSKGMHGTIMHPAEMASIFKDNPGMEMAIEYKKNPSSLFADVIVPGGGKGTLGAGMQFGGRLKRTERIAKAAKAAHAGAGATRTGAAQASKVMGSKVSIIADVNMGGGQKYAIIKGEGKNMAFYESSGLSHGAGSAAGRMNPFGGVTPYKWTIAPVVKDAPKLNRFGFYDNPGTRLVKYVGQDAGEVMQGGKLRRGKVVRQGTELGKISARLEGVVAGHQDPISLVFRGTKDPLYNINKGFEKLGKPGVTRDYLMDASINQHLKGSGALGTYRGEAIFENAPLVGLDSRIGPTITDMFKALDAMGM